MRWTEFHKITPVMLHLTCSYEVAVKRVCKKIVADRLGCSHQGLTHNLTPKQALSAGHPVVSSSGENTNIWLFIFE